MTFYLVQRLREQHYAGNAKGFDRLFACEYMGSAEFEFGSIPASLKRIRSAISSLDIVTVAIECDGVTRDVHFVGNLSRLDEKIGEFGTWLIGGCRGKEATYFDDAFAGTMRDYQQGVVAWWSLGDDIAWTLNRGIADKLLAGFTGQAVAA